MTTLLCLHGWGGSSASFTQLRKALEGTEVRILTPDFPGAGAAPEPCCPWHTEDYAAWIAAWLEHQEVPVTDGLFVLGHSHGGRVALALAAKNPRRIARLILCAPALNIARPQSVQQRIGRLLGYLRRTLESWPGSSTLLACLERPVHRLLGAHDYATTSPTMRTTMRNVIRDDVLQYFPRISAPIDVFWGEADQQTPITDLAVLRRYAPYAHCETFPGVRHAVHRDRAEEIAAHICRLKHQES